MMQPAGPAGGDCGEAAQTLAQSREWCATNSRQRTLVELLDGVLTQEVIRTLQHRRRGLTRETGAAAAEPVVRPADASRGLKALLEENFLASLISVVNYRELKAYLADCDPSSGALLNQCVAAEARHAKEMIALLDHLPN